MTDKLLPPDPIRDGWYWIDFDGRGMAPFLFTAYDQEWCRLSSGPKTRPEEAADWKWTLASPHPIPEPAELHALHQAISDLLDEMTLVANPGLASKASGWLRAALGIKP